MNVYLHLLYVSRTSYPHVREKAEFHWLLNKKNTNVCEKICEVDKIHFSITLTFTYLLFLVEIEIFQKWWILIQKSGENKVGLKMKMEEINTSNYTRFLIEPRLYYLSAVASLSTPQLRKVKSIYTQISLYWLQVIM